MEIKSLFWLLVFVAWIAFKFFEKFRHLFKDVVAKLEPPAEHKSVIPGQDVPSLPIVRKKKAPPDYARIKKPLADNLKTPIAPDILSFEPVSEPHSLIEELRSDKMDWRNAILLSEILKPVH